MGGRAYTGTEAGKYMTQGTIPLWHKQTPGDWDFKLQIGCWDGLILEEVPGRRVQANQANCPKCETYAKGPNEVVDYTSEGA